MYKRSDVSIMTTEKPSDETVELRACVRFYGAYTVSLDAIHDGGVETLEVAKEDARAVLHQGIYGEVADDLREVFRLGMEAVTAARKCSFTAANAQDAQSTEVAFGAAVAALINKLENHP